jgi:hypothetical protein
MFTLGQTVQCKLADPTVKPVGNRLAMRVVSVAGEQITVTWEDRDPGERTETFNANLLEPVVGTVDRLLNALKNFGAGRRAAS